MFPNCFIYSANGMFSPINGIRPAPRPASRAEQRADIKNRPAPHDEGRGENETHQICPIIENEKE